MDFQSNGIYLLLSDLNIFRLIMPASISSKLSWIDFVRKYINEVYSPFPIHGLDHALGLKPTRLAITSFIYGCTGLSLALLMMWYMMIEDWPMIIGGKPNFSLLQNLPAFIPVTFD